MTRTLQHLGILYISSIICMLPRFERRDAAFGVSFRGLTTDTSGDSSAYVLLVDYYRGLGPPGDTPFAYRQLTPYLASWLPWDPLFALAVVGVAGILIGVTAMYFATRAVSEDAMSAVVATLCFGVSFPVFYYSTVGLVDALTFGMATLCLWLMIRNKLALAVAAYAVAVFNKEVGMVMLGFCVPCILFNGMAKSEKVRYVACFVLVTVAAWYVTRNVLVAPGLTRFVWTPDFHYVAFNSTRFKTLLGILLSFGIQSAVAVYVWLRDFELDFDYFADPYKLGFAASAALAGYGFLTGQTDGRFIWYGQIFTTVVLAKELARWPRGEPLVRWLR